MEALAGHKPFVVVVVVRGIFETKSEEITV
jgi:hypothetical protein